MANRRKSAVSGIKDAKAEISKWWSVTDGSPADRLGNQLRTEGAEEAFDYFKEELSCAYIDLAYDPINADVTLSKIVGDHIHVRLSLRDALRMNPMDWSIVEKVDLVRVLREIATEFERTIPDAPQSYAT